MTETEEVARVSGTSTNTPADQVSGTSTNFEIDRVSGLSTNFDPEKESGGYGVARYGDGIYGGLLEGLLIFLRSFSVRLEEVKSDFSDVFVLNRFFDVVGDAVSVFDRGVEQFRGFNSVSDGFISLFDGFLTFLRSFSVGSGLVRSVFDRGVEGVRGFIGKMDEVRISWERIFTQLTRIRDKTLKVVKEKVKQIGGSIK